jgi:hypothetical protein
MTLNSSYCGMYLEPKQIFSWVSATIHSNMIKDTRLFYCELRYTVHVTGAAQSSMKAIAF